MASESQLVGGVSETLAQALFLRNGFSVATTVVPEPYDLLVYGKDSDGKTQIYTVQVKTIFTRRDRDNYLVVKGTGSDGVPYSKGDVDYIMGVHLDSSTGFLIENNEQTEYWTKDLKSASERWTEYRI